jgi:adenylyl-sulfate kinase
MTKFTKKKTSLIIGRWQPWHEGHRALFLAALGKAERVMIGVRHTYQTDKKNPFTFEEVKEFIDRDLSSDFAGKYDVIQLPNITNLVYGRDVGYKVEKISFEEDIEKISATQVRKSMNLTPVNHIVDVKERTKRFGHEGGIIWFTGLSGSGKSTLARALERKLFDKGYNVYMLDADNVRERLNSNLGFSNEDRNENIRRVGEVASLFAEAGFIVLCAFISPFKEDRKRAFNAHPKNFHEIYLSADISTCEDRDPKGLYKKARAGEIKEFTGIDSPYEIPKEPAMIIDTKEFTINESADELFNFILKKIPVK